VNLRQLKRRAVERVWGRNQLPAWAAEGEAAGAEPIGEIWFEDERGDEAELLVKYLFTSDRLSIQVHPDDQAARAAGYRRGKDEAWLVLDAEPGAEIGIGLKRELGPEELRSAALDGSIEQSLDRRRVEVGEAYYSPAGTIHAIGPGLTLLEVQQNVDLTYRLYDYGRPRELHLDEAVAVAAARPFGGKAQPRTIEAGREMIADGKAFAVERWRGPRHAAVRIDGSAVFIPIDGRVSLGGRDAAPGSAWAAEGEAKVSLGDGAELLLAYPASASITIL